MLKENADKDATLRHAAAYALSLLPQEWDAAKVARLNRSERLGVLLSLRKNKDAGIALFLGDADSRLVDEAIRAINDLDITGAGSALTDYSNRYTKEFSGTTPNEIMFRRLINTNFRLGSPQSALRLVQFGANAKLPTEFRRLALRAVALFPNPPSIDPTLGIYRPLEPRNRDRIRSAVEGPLVDIFKNATGDVAAAATRAIGVYGIQLDPNLLQARIRDGRQPVEVRQTAMEQLFANTAFSDKQLLKTIIDGYEPAMAAEAARIWVERHPDEIMQAVSLLLDRPDEEDDLLRAAYSILGRAKGEESAAALVSELKELAARTLYRTVHLDLYEAAQHRQDDSVQAALNDVDDFLASTNRTVFDFAREGGNPVKGQGVFENQGICRKCHQGSRGGGDAGPSLKNIARLRRPKEILQAILEPNAEIVPGYGIAAITLNDGTTIAGTPMEEDDAILSMKTPTGEVERIAKSDISNRTPSVSSMPRWRKFFRNKICAI